MHPPRWRRHQKSHSEYRDSDSAFLVPSCRSWSWRTQRRQLPTPQAEWTQTTAHPITEMLTDWTNSKTRLTNLSWIWRTGLCSEEPPYEAVVVSGLFWGNGLWNVCVQVSAPLIVCAHGLCLDWKKKLSNVSTAAFNDRLFHIFPTSHLRSSLLLRMSSGPRSLRLGKRGGGSMRRTGWGCDIILTGGWSRPPANTSGEATEDKFSLHHLKTK